MLVMGSNHWENDIPENVLVKQALRFADGVKAQGIAELRNFFLAQEQKLLWCTWETSDLEALRKAFAEMNEQSGLISELTPVEDKYPGG